MTQNGLFVLGRPETQLHDILWVVHDEKSMVEERKRKYRGVPCYGGWSVLGNVVISKKFLRTRKIMVMA